MTVFDFVGSKFGAGAFPVRRGEQDIEASTSVDLASTMILPAVARYLGILSAAPSSAGVNRVCEQVSRLADRLVEDIEHLQHAQHQALAELRRQR